MPLKSVFAHATTSAGPRGFTKQPPARAALIALGLVLLTAPAWPQPSPPHATIPSCLPPTGSGFSSGGDFFTNFVDNPAYQVNPYQISLPSSNASTAAGDLNSTYYTMYYSVANASLVTNGGILRRPVHSS
jgi:hypothetical protein